MTTIFKVNNNTHTCDCENVTNLAGEFRGHKSQGKTRLPEAL